MDMPERIARLEAQVESIKVNVADLKNDVKDLHSRITTGNREILDSFERKMDELAQSDRTQHESLRQSMESVKDRVDILEKWRWMIVGGAIVLGYVVGHFEIASKIFG